MKPGSTVCLDFDGVIHTYDRGWQQGELYGDPTEGALETIIGLIKDHHVVICTARSDLAPIRAWLEKWGFPALMVTNQKPVADIYVDDRAIRFLPRRGWRDVTYCVRSWENPE